MTLPTIERTCINAEHVGQIKDILHDILNLYRGYGEVTIEVRNGEITRIAMLVYPYNRGQPRKDEPC